MIYDNENRHIEMIVCNHTRTSTIYIYTLYIQCFAHVYDSCTMTPNDPLDGASCWLECIDVYCKDYKKGEKDKHLEGGGIIYTIYTCNYMCVYIYMHIYIYIYKYIHAYIPTYLHTVLSYVYIYIFTQYVCIYERYIYI